MLEASFSGKKDAKTLALTFCAHLVNLTAYMARAD